MLGKTPSLYDALYALATAWVGNAVCDPRWAKEDERPGLLTPALAEYRRALEIAPEPGVVQDALHDLKMIGMAGVAGLAPAIELLEEHVNIGFSPVPAGA
jgi:hypothetical protein